MSDSNWGGENKDRLKDACVIAFLFLIVVLGVGLETQSAYYNSADSRAAYHASNANNQIEAECGIVSPPPKCKREVEQSYRSEKRA
jgi:hypothetical protein